MNLKSLHENFLEKARKPMLPGRLPIQATPADAPIIAVERWTQADGRLTKVFRFREQKRRHIFVTGLLEHEDEVGHHAVITIKGDTVRLVLTTDGPGHVTELDKDYARFADELFRDVVYNPYHGKEHLRDL